MSVKDRGALEEACDALTSSGDTAILKPATTTENVLYTAHLAILQRDVTAGSLVIAQYRTHAEYSIEAFKYFSGKPH